MDWTWNRWRGLSAAAILLATAPAAHAGTLIVSRSLDFLGQPISGSLDFVNPTTLATQGGFNMPDKVTGLAYGQGQIFVSSAPGATIKVFNPAGAQIGGTQLPPVVTPNHLAFDGGGLYAGETTFVGNGFDSAVFSLNPSGFGDIGNGFDTDGLENGLAAGGGDAFASLGNKIERFGSNGVMDGAFDLGPYGAAGALAYGDGKVFAAYSLSADGFIPFHIVAFDAQTLNPLFGFATEALAQSLAFGDGGLFASYGDSLVRYDENGSQTASINEDMFSDGQLAFMPDAGGGPIGGRDGGVPEPASWALLIAGFGLAGAGLRRRRRRATPG